MYYSILVLLSDHRLWIWSLLSPHSALRLSYLSVPQALRNLWCSKRCEGRAEKFIYLYLTGWAVLWKRTLANRLQLAPDVRAAHLKWGLIGKDVVAQFFQLGFGVCGGKLSSVFDFLPHRHINLLQAQQGENVSDMLSHIHSRLLNIGCLFLGSFWIDS